MVKKNLFSQRWPHMFETYAKNPHLDATRTGKGFALGGVFDNEVQEDANDDPPNEHKDIPHDECVSV